VEPAATGPSARLGPARRLRVGRAPRGVPAPLPPGAPVIRKKVGRHRMRGHPCVTAARQRRGPAACQRAAGALSVLRRPAPQSKRARATSSGTHSSATRLTSSAHVQPESTTSAVTPRLKKSSPPHFRHCQSTEAASAPHFRQSNLVSPPHFRFRTAG